VAGLTLALFLQGFERYAWVTTAYLLASTAMIPVVGKLGDERGRAIHEAR
jgi:MFS family permease